MEPVASHGAPVATATPPPTAGVVSSHAAPTATATGAPVTSAWAQVVIDAWSRGTSYEDATSALKEAEEIFAQERAENQLEAERAASETRVFCMAQSVWDHIVARQT